MVCEVSSNNRCDVDDEVVVICGSYQEGARIVGIGLLSVVCITRTVVLTSLVVRVDNDGMSMFSSSDNVNKYP